MLYCEDCRLRDRLNRPAVFPYHHTYKTKCEICSKHKECYDQPAIYAKQKKNWTFEEKHLDKMLQHEYHQKAEELIIAFVSGAHAGAIDYQRSEALKKAIIKVNDEIDWFATFELRQRIQDGYRRADELSRNRR